MNSQVKIADKAAFLYDIKQVGPENQVEGFTVCMCNERSICGIFHLLEASIRSANLPYIVIGLSSRHEANLIAMNTCPMPWLNLVANILAKSFMLTFSKGIVCKESITCGKVIWEKCLFASYVVK